MPPELTAIYLDGPGKGKSRVIGCLPNEIRYPGFRRISTAAMFQVEAVYERVGPVRDNTAAYRYVRDERVT